MNKTIALVKPEPREVHRNDGSTSFVVSVVFVDGEEGSRWTNSRAQATEETERLRKLVGQEHDFNLTKPRDYQGVTQYTISDYPGAPERKRSGGGGMSDHQVALLAAASAAPGSSVQVIIDIARTLEAEWFGAPPATTSQPATTKPTEVEPVVRTDGPSLSQIVQLRGLAAELGWSEAEALEVADVGAWNSLTKATAQALVEDWARQLEERDAF